MNQFRILALTHRSLGLDLVGRFHVEPEKQHSTFAPRLGYFGIREFMFISTCNRVEFFVRCTQPWDENWVAHFLGVYYPEIPQEELQKAVAHVRTYEGQDAVRHLFHVSSSLDSLIVGEREIITQVRTAFERAYNTGLCGDFIRIAVQKAIETAKQVYSETEIAAKPVSVVNLGYRRLLERQLNNDHRVVYIGAGQTIEAIAGNMKAFHFASTRIFNRTPEKAEKLATVLGAQGFGLDALADSVGDFDVIVTCTGSETPIITKSLYKRLQEASPGRKIILDLAVPADVAADVRQDFDIDYISISDLKSEAAVNLRQREKEIFHCEALVEQRLAEFEETFKVRKLELAMAQVPELMKRIKTNAIEKKFARHIERMDGPSREALLEIIDYLEKKYIALPMKMAREVVLNQDLKDPVVD